MNAFDINGSFLYALFPGPRYAFRELDYLRLIPGRRDPALRVSGEELLRMLDMVMVWAETKRAARPPAPARVPVVREDPAVVEPPAVPESAAVIAAEPPPPPPAPVVQEEPAVVEPPAAPESVAVIAEEPPPPPPAPVVREEPAVVEPPAAPESAMIAAAEPPAPAPARRETTKERGGVSVINIQFLPDSVELTVREKSRLREIVAILLENPGKRVLVEGHTARAGSAQGRLRISIERALAAADFLIGMNAQLADRITVVGYGAERPLENHSAEADQAMNRRVEVVLLDEGR
jgi:outer membrane protein OmpA-like peptidoglycan-associated protein